MLNRRLTGALAWAGLLLVIGVPSADFLTRSLSPEGEQRTDAAVISPAPAVTPNPTATTTKPSALPPIVPAKPAPVAKAEEAKPGPSSGAPVDQFLSKGKKLPSYISGGDAAPASTATPVAAPSGPTPTPPATTDVASLPPVEIVAPVPMPASMRPKPRVAERPLVVRPVNGPVPPADVVGRDELADWDSGSLADYLARKGLLNGSDEGYFAEEVPF